MAIYVIADLHLSFSNPKPMNIFGDCWENHEEKIKNDWLEKVKEDDIVLLLGDFSWAMSLKDALKDFEYINNLPGKKILLKGNHDYWWTTITNMKKVLSENQIRDVDFLQNNAFLVEDKIICGTRGWAINLEETENSKKMIAREANRLKLSIEKGIQDFGNDKEIIVCMHYPPILQSNIAQNEISIFMQIMKQYNVKRCYYGHLHGISIKDAINDNIYGIELKLVSADGANFKLQKIEP